MNDLVKSPATKPDVSEGIQTKWQRILDLMARVLGVPAGLIMRVDSHQMEVFVASATPKNPFRKGQRADLQGLYCEKVLKERGPLLVPDALKDPEWDQSPGVKLGMTFYIGYPLTWPDGELFGTICIFDEKENPRATQFRNLIFEFRQVVEKDLRLMIKAREREDLLAELQCYRDHLQKIVAQQTAELEKSKVALEERLRFENLISDLCARLVNAPPERMDDEIAFVLDKICRFFAADHCGLLEVLPDRRQIHFVNLDHQSKRGPELNVDKASSHPWAYHQLIEEGDPVIFSSLQTLPPEASVDRGNWEKEGIQAVLAIPLHIERQVRYVITLFSRRLAHEWTLAHIPRLQVLGEIFANALDRRSVHQTLLKSQRGLAEAERMAHLGSWIWDIDSGTHYWSDELYRILGLVPRECGAAYKTFLASVHPDDRQAVDQANHECLTDPEKTYNIEYRVVRPDGAERVVHARAELLYDLDRKPISMIGMAQDITERKLGEEALQKALDEVRKLKERLEAENIYLREEIDLRDGFTRIIGDSDSIKYAIHRIKQVARTRATILLTGETGTGKGIFARALHEASDRKDKPFVHVNCAGLPANLIESELFGREKGAFTGSTARQIGRFELANGGTIFLDEIGELPIELQAKLLKVIEDGEFERLGSPHPVKVDVRIIACTNRDLEEQIKKGQFRNDLFYRLNVFPVTIPPLRQRKEDIPLLVKFYTAKFSKTHGKAIKKIPVATMKAFGNYNWPGNVRELMNVVERAVILAVGPELRLGEKLDAVAHVEEISPAEETAEKKSEIKGISQLERGHILKTLRETGWKIEGENGAAKVLEMNPSTLRARMKKLGITRPKAS